MDTFLLDTMARLSIHMDTNLNNLFINSMTTTLITHIQKNISMKGTELILLLTMVTDMPFQANQDRDLNLIVSINNISF